MILRISLLQRHGTPPVTSTIRSSSSTNRSSIRPCLVSTRLRLPRCLALSSFASFSSSSSSSTLSLSTTQPPRQQQQHVVVVPVVIVGGGPVGLFLSSLLAQYQIPCLVLERQSVQDRFRHPAAHFFNTRTMEILQQHLPWSVIHAMRHASPPLSEWTTFAWGRSLNDSHPLATVVHPVHRPIQVGCNANGVLLVTDSDSITTTNNTTTNTTTNSNYQNDIQSTIQSQFPTTQPLSPVSVQHLAQHTFGKILYDHVAANLQEHVTLRYETQVTDIQVVSQRGGDNNNNNNINKETALLDTSARPAVQIKTHRGDVIYANLCLAADGSNSFVRQQLGIPWDHTTQPPLQQELYNIHVRLTDQQIQEYKAHQVPAHMLYTTLNPTAVAMVVRHGPAEYNIQVPTFPPYQKGWRTPQELSPLLHSIFGFVDPNNKIDVETQVLSCAPWTMTSRVAGHYVHRSNAVALVGDAAHVFPPAGGLGLNTGLQDAHNLVWKLAAVAAVANNNNNNNNTMTTIGAALQSYQQERRPIALQNAALSIRNYHRLLDVTKQLYLDESHPQLLRQSLDGMAAFLPLSVRQTMFESLYKAALQPLGWLSDLQSTYRQHITKRIRRKLAQGSGLPLLFPRHEVLFDYTEKASNNQQSYWQDTLCPTDVGLKVGRRLPYIVGEDWLTRPGPSSATPAFTLLFRRGAVDANLADWLAQQLQGSVQVGTSEVVPNADSVVLVRPDDMVAAVLTRCSQTPDFETLLVQAALDSFQQL